MNALIVTAQERLSREPNIWLATVRPDRRPHLTPIWFVWWEEKIYICTTLNSVKARNLQQNPHVCCSLEDGSQVVIAEGTAQLLPRPWPSEVAAQFQQKYDWNIMTDTDYNCLIGITPHKWLSW